MRRLLLLLLPALLVPAAWAQSDTRAADTRASGETRPLNRAEEVAQKIEKQVEKLRGLAFKEPVKIGVYDKPTLKEFLLKQADKDLKPERIEPYARALKALALIPQDLDLRQTILDLMMDQIAGFYDPDGKELRLIDRSSAELDSIIMAHELTHALQDQHFKLKSLPVEVEDDDDLATASKAVVEGDASIVMMAWPASKMKNFSVATLFSTEMAARLEGMGSLAALSGGAAVAEAPAFLREGLIFPYVGGMKFCITIASDAKNFEPIDRALKTPPLSTEQIIHPEKYSGSTVDYPTAFVLPDLSETLGMTKLTSNTLGELGARILLDEKLKKKDAVKAAAGWDGDRYVLYGKPGSPDAIAWISTWDSEEDADEFETALEQWLAALNPGSESAKSDVTSARYVREDGTLDAIARKGLDVILLRGVPKDKLIPVLQKLFEETTRSERKKV